MSRKPARVIIRLPFPEKDSAKCDSDFERSPPNSGRGSVRVSQLKLDEMWQEKKKK